MVKIKKLHYFSMPLCNLCAVIMVFFFCNYGCNRAFAQNAPKPAFVPYQNESGLMASLQAGQPDVLRVKNLISLASLFYTNPENRLTSLEKSYSYAKQAKELSTKLKYEAGKNNALFQMALVSLQKDDAASAEKTLPFLNDTTKLKLLLNISWEYLNNLSGKGDNSVSSTRYGQQAKVLAKKYKHTQALLLIDGYSALNLINQGNYQAADSALKSLEEKYKVAGNKKLQYIYLMFAILNRRSGHKDIMLEYNIKAVNTMKTVGDFSSAGDLYLSLGQAFVNTDQPNRAIESFQNASIQYKQRAGLASMFYLNQCIVEAYFRLGQYARALHFITVNQRAYPPKNIQEKGLLFGMLGDCYLKLKDFKLAESYFLKENQIWKAREGMMLYATTRLSNFYVESKNYAKAGPLLRQSLSLPNPSLTSQAKLRYNAFLVDSAIGNLPSAVRNLNVHRQLKDSIAKLEKSELIQKLSIQYESANKNQRIKLLEQKEQLSSANLQRSELIKNLTIGGIIILMIVSAIVYYLFLQKKKSSLLIHKKNTQLNQLVSEKEWLLKEIHHRVKNNLHTVICLLEIQSEYLKDDALEAIENSQHRIYAMSLLHQKLYQSPNVKKIEMSEYLPELVGYLKNTITNPQLITFALDISKIELDIAQAMPLGLIINEAVTNSIKYAFPHSRTGKIGISLNKKDDNIILKVSDDGIGISDIQQISRNGSLGLKLMNGLSADINALFEVKNTNGTLITITFNPNLFGDNFDREEEKLNIVDEN